MELELFNPSSLRPWRWVAVAFYRRSPCARSGLRAHNPDWPKDLRKRIPCAGVPVSEKSPDGSLWSLRPAPSYLPDSYGISSPSPLCVCVCVCVCVCACACACVWCHLLALLLMEYVFLFLVFLVIFRCFPGKEGKHLADATSFKPVFSICFLSAWDSWTCLVC